ncbi:hypothetical protein [Streptomyces iconiensis]|uniref:ATP-binding protein n=1 Tax=Streptomyces iconiensis TaxID=1384038 RepID=A0ABT6ZWC7_9ACTN|nr:hypothetical protein [Streptomyces iconiensis]MDJ1132926.1 hypothetical protein [Streptomyces iconiensis]
MASAPCERPLELELCFPAVDYFERLGVPFLVVVNCFSRTRSHTTREIARALGLEPRVPVTLLDARDRDVGKEALVRLIEYVAGRHRTALLGEMAVTDATGI